MLIKPAKHSSKASMDLASIQVMDFLLSLAAIHSPFVSFDFGCLSSSMISTLSLDVEYNFFSCFRGQLPLDPMIGACFSFLFHLSTLALSRGIQSQDTAYLSFSMKTCLS